MQNICHRCTETGGEAHSFYHIGTLGHNKKTHLYYTKPADATDIDESPEAIAIYLHHFEQTKPHPWIWILDCQGLKTKDFLHSGLGRRITEVVKTTYIDTLQGIYVVNPTWGMKTLLTFITPLLSKESKARIHCCNLGLLDVMARLETLGLPAKETNALLTRMSTAVKTK